MDKKSSMVLFGILPAIYLVLAFLYIIFVLQPALFFHHVQPPFILSADFLRRYFEYPGGFSELAANFFLQSFHDRYLGPIVFIGIVLILWWLVFKLMNSGERIPRRLCRGVSEQDTKQVFDGTGFIRNSDDKRILLQSFPGNSLTSASSNPWNPHGGKFSELICNGHPARFPAGSAAGSFNIILALATLTLAIVLTNNYNFPFSVIISMVMVLTLLLLLAKMGRSTVSYLAFYTAGAVIVYYLCGSGYLLLFSAGAILLTSHLKLWARVLVTVFIAIFSFLFPLVAYNFIFALPPDNRYFYFFAPQPYFIAYDPPVMFYVFMVSVPVLLALAGIAVKFETHRINAGKKPEQNHRAIILKTALAYAVILTAAFFSHQATYRADAKKIVASDYYCYISNPGKTDKAATTTRDYSFIANMNYNLAISKAGRLNDDFFGFFQIAGTDAVHPDNEFLAERSFIAADFYYHLGYISEARHWAYESLVYFPYSLRAMQILVKIHLVTGEYKAAGKYLEILNKGLTDRSFVRKYTPFIKDTLLTSTDREITGKRSLIPAEKELDPIICGRFRELLEANAGNKIAYEFLMIFYILDAQLENFVELYKEAGRYFSEPVAIYEEALLMYGDITGTDVISMYKINPATVARFNDFRQKISRFKGDEMSARNSLYREYGKTCMYYLQFVYPRIIKPEIISEDDEEQSI